MALPVITGDKALDRKLRAMGAKVEKRVVRSAMSKALTVLKKAIQSEVPIGPTKNLKRAIGKRLEQIEGLGITDGKAGVNVGKRTPARIRASAKLGLGVGGAPHGHLVGLGTKPRFHKKSGKFVGWMPSNNFVQRGVDKGMAAYLLKLRQAVKKGIEREAAKR